jgi:NADH dehydrogenase
LVDAQSRVLPGLDPRASEYAARALRSRRVDLVLDAQISEVTARGVRLADGRELRAEVVIWVAGVTVDGTFASTLPASTGGGGRVLVRGDLSLDEHPEVFVVGDAAAVSPRRVEDGGPPRLLPQIAQVAIQSGEHVARQIIHRAVGEPTAGFVYRDRGMMATIGRRAAIAQFSGGRIIWGTTGWLAWLVLHLVYLVGFRNRAVVLVNWAWRYFKWPSGPRLILGDVASGPVTSPPAQDPIVDRDAVRRPARSTPRAGAAPGRW